MMNLLVCGFAVAAAPAVGAHIPSVVLSQTSANANKWQKMSTGLLAARRGAEVEMKAVPGQENRKIVPVRP